MASDMYFLSARNPLATVDQRHIEEAALRVLEHPAMQAARLQAGQLFRWVMAADMSHLMSRFDGFLDEYMFHYAMRAAGNDPAYPRIMHFMSPPHRSFGRDVPGSRWGGDSPDFIYRSVATSFGPRYEIYGQETCETPPSVTFTLLEDRQASSVVMSTLDSIDMEFGPEGAFTITVDPSPANGRRNHIQTRPGCYAIWVRDALGDWATSSPNRIRVHRLDPPGRLPLGDDEMANWGAKAALDGVYYLYYLTRTSWLMEPNVMRPPTPTAALGGMPGQFSAGGRLQIGPDEALVVNLNGAGALFRNIVLTDPFWRTLDYCSRQTSLNAGQSAADADGTYTYVVSHRDPGIHNWQDACGESELRLSHRWQSFPMGEPEDEIRFAAKLVKFADLESELPAGVRRIDAAGRQRQIAQREDGCRLRFSGS
ncbi:hypothetical protein LK12_23115 [Novosphingobium malaysiense]|uniref:DUF1214 domain-containing protein n=2 Tax=Novosphingobium malaysiense TaxID=1348853 RepID=A0A0B1ZIF0_9SPHN|nr:hypothetical protein LK12_23115 [Novosphingobium malaysiense]